MLSSVDERNATAIAVEQARVALAHNAILAAQLRQMGAPSANPHSNARPIKSSGPAAASSAAASESASEELGSPALRAATGGGQQPGRVAPSSPLPMTDGSSSAEGSGAP